MKIKGATDYAWVTIVRDDGDVLKAGILVASLKRVLTSHQSICICLGSELTDKYRSKLISYGFHHVVCANESTDNQSIESILHADASDITRKSKKIVLLPVDSIVLKNCDELMTDTLETTNSNSTDDLLSKELDNCLIISRDEGNQKSCLLVSSSTFRTLNCGSPAVGNSRLEAIPSIIRLPGLTRETVSRALTSHSGLLEKEIINYWDTLQSNVAIVSITPKNSTDEGCTWLSEPIAIIGTADSSGSIASTCKSALIESGLHASSLAPSSTAIFTAAIDPNTLCEFSAEIKKSSNCLSKLNPTACPSSTAALTTAIKALHDNCLTKETIIFYRDAKARISVLVLKRLSQAVEHGNKIQALLGPCSIRSNENSSNNKPAALDLEIVDLVDAVRFLNLRGPLVNKTWMNLESLSSSHKRESAIIPHLFDHPTDSGSYPALVISTSYIEPVESSYPKWNLNLERPLHCIALQHENSKGLDKLLENLKKHLTSTDTGSVSFPNLAYTLNSKITSSCENSQPGSRRAVIIAKDLEESGKLLNTNGYLKEEPMKENAQKLCFLFTGQGSQYPGMAKLLYENCPIFRLALDRCNSLFRQMYKIDIHDVIYKNSAELSRTLYSQTSIFCVEYALLQTWKSWGIQPDIVVGHSLGEFSAAVAAGALELEDAMKLVGERSRLIDELPRGKMLVLRGDQKSVQDLLNEFTRENPGSWLDFAAINSKDQTVLSGDSKWVEQFAAWAGAKKVRSLVLEATHAFHSRHMEPMLEKYRKVAETCKGDLMPKRGIVFISGMEGKVMRSPLNPDYWVRHTREPVRFVQASRAMWDEGCRVFVECGPQPILSALAKVNMTTIMGGSGTVGAPVFLPSIRKGIDDWKTILATLAKLWMQGTREVDWRGFEKYFERKLIQDDVTVVKEILME